jgi:hypothetical protein
MKQRVVKQAHISSLAGKGLELKKAEFHPLLIQISVF